MENELLTPLGQMEERKIFQISEINQQVKALLHTEFDSIWIEGELSNVAMPSSGHLYFSLKDQKAQLRCAMFRSQGRLLNFKPTEGMQVLVRGRLSLYEPRGDFQLIVSHMEPVGDGALQRAFEALKKKLAAEGLFNPEHKQAIPAFPNQIGVITSATGAAIHDILSVSRRRFPSIPVIIYPASVQGKTAAATLCQAIELANQRQECDVLVLTRGGGSLEDLWPFNDETLARCIFKSNIPIVSAVGHEIDFTIADFVADCRAPTPSAAAEIVWPNQAEIKELINNKTNLLIQSITRLIQYEKNKLLVLNKGLLDPKQILQTQQQKLDYLVMNLQRLIQYQLQQQRNKFNLLQQSLKQLNPKATLARGYAIVTDTQTNKVIESIKMVQADATLTIQVQDGEFDVLAKS